MVRSRAAFGVRLAWSCFSMACSSPGCSSNRAATACLHSWSTRRSLSDRCSRCPCVSVEYWGRSGGEEDPKGTSSRRRRYVSVGLPSCWYGHPQLGLGTDDLHLLRVGAAPA